MVDTVWRSAPLRFVSVYFPPNSSRQAARELVIRALRANPPPGDGIPTYWGGDVNLQWADPRDGESNDVATRVGLLTERQEAPSRRAH